MSNNQIRASRIVHHGDALKWLKEQSSLLGCSIITSLPDISEFPKLNLAQWKDWFVDTAALVMSRCPDEGLTLFYQTDIRKEGAWIDKAFLCQKAAEQVGHVLIAHKIICRAPVGTETFGKPGYSHLLCFSKHARTDISASFADVLPDAGEVTWTRGMGINACRLGCEMVMNCTNTRIIVDPFCGHGTVLAVANELGLDAIGVEHKLKYFKKAKAFELSQTPE